MLSKKLLIGFAALGIGIASAASDYKVELTQPTHVGATELKAGTYKVEVEGDKAVFKSGKEVVAQSPGDCRKRQTEVFLHVGFHKLLEARIDLRGRNDHEDRVGEVVFA